MRIHDYIQQHIFARRAAERGCLVIYDPARRYRDLALALAGPACAVLDAGASLIAQREAAMKALRDLSSGGLQKLIVWAPLAKPETDEQAQRDPFSVLARVGAVFPRGDDDEYASLCRSAKPDHLTELERLFAEGEPSFATVDALDEGGSWPQLKSMLQAASAKEILLGLLVPKPEQETILRESPPWVGEAREFIQRTLGHKLRTKGQTRATVAEELWRLLLFSEFVFDTRGELPASLSTVPVAAAAARGLIFDVCDDLRKHQDYRPVYLAAAEAVEAALVLPERAAAMPNLGLRDTFAFEERFHLRQFVAAVQAGEFPAARTILHARQHSIWLTHECRLAEWSVAERALELVECIEHRPPPSFASLEAMVRAYADGWRELDRRHRELEQALADWHDDDDSLDALILEARQRYLKLAGALQSEFLRHVAAEGWPAHDAGLLRNSEVFDREVGPSLDARQKVAFILVDSLRFELAAELEKQLSPAHRVRLLTVCAQLPTYTEVGMASLMPEASTALAMVEKDGKLVTTLAGIPASDPATRFAYLQSKKGDLCHDLTLDDLLQHRKLRIPEKARLLVVRTREIDAVAHESPRGVLRLIPDLLRQLMRAVARLESAGFQRVVLATDHGFILVHEQEAGNATPYPPGNWLVRKSRCLLGTGEADGSSLVLPREQVGITGDFQHYATPKALVPYVRQPLYYHEGLSLQECVLPCLTIDLAVQPARKAPPNLQISYRQGRTDKITTRRPVLDLAWSELALDDQELEVAIEAADAKGTVVGCVSSGPTVNLATQGVRIRAGQAVPISLRMDDYFVGHFTVRVHDPATQALIAELKLRTDYAV
ncbi:MAG: PglZ domain-containing protein [Verrucomicrobiales bacterium]|nr:PglZ domain-containing protein [Verrucomicrobiales bacterium]